MSDSKLEDEVRRVLELLHRQAEWPDEARDSLIDWFSDVRESVSAAVRSEFQDAMRRRFGASRTERSFSFARYAGSATSFLGRYLAYTEMHEAAEIYHFWAAVGALSFAVGRRAWFDNVYYKVHCNDYIVLVGDTGLRKTTATDIAVDIARDALPLSQMDDKRFIQGVAFIYEKATPEAILAKLSMCRKKRRDGLEYCELAIYAPELAVFLGRQTYNEGLVSMLTSIGDARESQTDHLTKNRGQLNIVKPTITLLGGTTREWLGRALSSDEEAGGFVGRFVFVVANAKRRLVAFHSKNGDYATQRSELVAQLREIGQFEGEFEQTDDAKRWATEWYEQGQQVSPSMAGYYERRQAHLIRLAMLMAISDGCESAMIELDHYHRALAVLEETERFMPTALSHVAAHEESKLIDVVNNHLTRAADWVEVSRLLRAVYRRVGSAKTFNEVIRTMKDADMVETQNSEGRAYVRAKLQP